MDVLGDAIRRDRRSDRTALRAPAVGRSYDYRRFCTSAWKTGNFLRHLGVRSGAAVAIADDPVPEPVIAFFGAALLGGVVQFAPPTGGDEGVRAHVLPASELGRRDSGSSTKRIAYGDDPGDPTVAYFERDVWSENPTEPPDSVAGADTLLRTPAAEYTHREAIEAAEGVVESYDLGADDQVVVDGSFENPTVVVAGLIVPIVAGGAIALGADTTSALVVGGPESDVDVDSSPDELVP